MSSGRSASARTVWDRSATTTRRQSWSTSMPTAAPLAGSSVRSALGRPTRPSGTALSRHSPRPDTDRRVSLRHIDQDQLGLFVGGEAELLGAEDLRRIARAEAILVHPHGSSDQVEIAGAVLLEAVLDLGAGLEGGDVRRRVLMDRDDVAAFPPDHLEQLPEA